MSLKKKIITKSLPTDKINKPDTITRAGITANLKFTRGKQLVEQDPLSLIPDPYNPRPGEIIDENWLKQYLFIGTSESLCRISDETGEFVIPEFSELGIDSNDSIEESYSFLRDLAFSIRIDGLIEPIEIFLADRNNDPDYFENSKLDYGYVILEGHQRRLAALMGAVPSVTCIEITDESMLVKLKVKHRKLRRQLSENNLRKNLTVSQNFQIFNQFVVEQDVKTLKNKELASIMGLSEGIISALRTISSKPENYPPIFFSHIQNNKLTFKMIRSLISKSYGQIETILTDQNSHREVIISKSPKARGRQGGAVKKYATFKVSSEKETESLLQILRDRFPEVEKIETEDSLYKNLENILNKIKEIAITKISCSGA